MRLSPLNQRRWRNFTKNRRAYWSLIIFAVLFVVSLFAEVIANDKPILVSYRGDLRAPFMQFYPETAFGGDFKTEAIYRDPEVQCLIRSGGLEACWDDPFGVMEDAGDGIVAGEKIDKGWILWAPIRHRYNTISDVRGAAPSPPNVIGLGKLDLGPVWLPYPKWIAPKQEPWHWIGTDDTKRDVLARVVYGFRLSIVFALIVTTAASIIGIAAGAVQGFFGGWIDLVFQRALEIWGAVPSLYVIIIMFAILGRSFWLLVVLSIVFGWPALVGVVRAEFLRARNFEYVRAARALGVSSRTIMFRHMLPNAMVATLTMLPFIVTGTIGSLAALDFLGYGLPSSAPSLGELSQQAKQNLQAPWLIFAAFTTYAVMLSLLVFIFEGVRDAFDPRKTFQ